MKSEHMLIMNNFEFGLLYLAGMDNIVTSWFGSREMEKSATTVRSRR